MELSAAYVSHVECSKKLLSVSASGTCAVETTHGHSEGVNEVEVRSRWKTLKKTSIHCWCDFVESNVRDLDTRGFIEELHRVVDESKSSRVAILGGGRAEQLHTETDTEQVMTSLHGAAYCVVEPFCSQSFHRETKRANAREDDVWSRLNDVWFVGDVRIATQVAQSACHREQIAHAVVDDDDGFAHYLTSKVGTQRPDFFSKSSLFAHRSSAASNSSRVIP